MIEQPFSGDKKVGTSILHHPEQRFIRFAVPKVPAWLQTYHLTLMTIPISLCIVGCSFLALLDIRWLWGVSLMVALHWLTDSSGGAVGRAGGLLEGGGGDCRQERPDVLGGAGQG